MKIFTLFCFLITSIQVFSQSVVKTHEFDNDDLCELHNFPNDPQNMLGAQLDYASQNTQYSFLKIEASSATPINFPTLTRITSLPMSLMIKLFFRLNLQVLVKK